MDIVLTEGVSYRFIPVCRSNVDQLGPLSTPGGSDEPVGLRNQSPRNSIGQHVLLSIKAARVLMKLIDLLADIIQP